MKKKTYYICIKSHCEAPDYEDSCEAISKIQAVRFLKKKLEKRSEDWWDKDFVFDNTWCPEDGE